MTVEQIKAARALLRWNQADLAKASGVSLPTIRRLEAQTGPLTGYSRTQDAIREAIEMAGIEFVEAGSSSAPAGAGVRLKGQSDE